MTPNMLDIVNTFISPAYLVGGPVRDELLGRPVHDYDFATPLTPDEIEAAVRLAGRKPYLTGKRFGTIGFKVEGMFVEVTSFRGEMYEHGNRKPDVVFGATIEEDLARRDFTINAMAQSPEGEIIDLFGGTSDLKAGIIKAVGNPLERFLDDPLRILRAARFAAQLDFEIEGETLSAMEECAPSLRSVAIQRASTELDALLVGINAARGIRYLEQTHVLSLFLPELIPQISLGQLEDTLRRVNACERELEIRWTALLETVEIPYLNHTSNTDAAAHIRSGFAKKIGTYLHWSNARIKTVQESLSGQIDPNHQA